MSEVITVKGIDCKKEMGKMKSRVTRLFGQGKISRFDFDDLYTKLEVLDTALKEVSVSGIKSDESDSESESD